MLPAALLCAAAQLHSGVLFIAALLPGSSRSVLSGRQALVAGPEQIL